MATGPHMRVDRLEHVPKGRKAKVRLSRSDRRVGLPPSEKLSLRQPKCLGKFN